MSDKPIKLTVEGKIYEESFDGIQKHLRSGSAAALAQSQMAHIEAHMRAMSVEHILMKLSQKVYDSGIDIDFVESITLYNNLNHELQAVRLMNENYYPEDCLEDFWNKFLEKNYKEVNATDLAIKMYPNVKVSKNNKLYIKR
jgi:hypothetical protein